MTQLELDYRRTGTARSQSDAILALLRARQDWVPMPELARESGSLNVHSRIADLRRRGFTVENRQQVGQDGVRLSWYKLGIRCEHLGSSAD